MKTSKIMAGAMLFGLMLISINHYASVTVRNTTCHSMFVVVQWGPGPGCSPTGATNGVVAANSTGSLSGTPGAGEYLTYVYATLNAYSCTLYQPAWQDCAGWEQYGSSTCCVTDWQVEFDLYSASVDPI